MRPFFMAAFGIGCVGAKLAQQGYLGVAKYEVPVDTVALEIRQGMFFQRVIRYDGWTYGYAFEEPMRDFGKGTPQFGACCLRPVLLEFRGPVLEPTIVETAFTPLRPEPYKFYVTKK